MARVNGNNIVSIISVSGLSAALLLMICLNTCSGKKDCDDKKPAKTEQKDCNDDVKADKVTIINDTEIVNGDKIVIIGEGKKKVIIKQDKNVIVEPDTIVEQPKKPVAPVAPVVKPKPEEKPVATPNKDCGTTIIIKDGGVGQFGNITNINTEPKKAEEKYFSATIEIKKVKTQRWVKVK